MLELGQPLHAYDERASSTATSSCASRAKARSSRCSTAQVLDLTRRPAAGRRREEAARPRRHHGRRALGHRRRHDATCFSKARSGTRRSSRARCARLGFTATPAIASSAASTSAAARRAVERATAADPRDLRRTRRAARRRRRATLPRARRRCACARARVARLLGIAIAADDDRRRCSRASACRFARDGDDFVVTPPSLPLRPRDRGRLRRGGRAHPRLRRAFPPRRARTSQHMLPAPEGARPLPRCKHAPRRPRLAGSRHVQLRVVADAEAALDRGGMPVTRAESDRQPPRRDAHVAAGRACIETLRTNVNRKAGARAHLRDRPRASCATATVYDAAAAHRRPRVRRRAARAMGRDAARDVDFFDVKGDVEALAAPLRARHRRAPRIRRCIPGARRACASTAATSAGSASCTRAWCAQFELASGAGRVRGRPATR